MKNFAALAVALIVASWSLSLISGYDSRAAWLVVIIILLGAGMTHPEVWGQLGKLVGGK